MDEAGDALGVAQLETDSEECRRRNRCSPWKEFRCLGHQTEVRWAGLCTIGIPGDCGSGNSIAFPIPVLIQVTSWCMAPSGFRECTGRRFDSPVAPACNPWPAPSVANSASLRIAAQSMARAQADALLLRGLVPCNFKDKSISMAGDDIQRRCMSSAASDQRL